MSARDHLRPVALLIGLGLLSGCAGTPDLASLSHPTTVQFASVDPSQPLAPTGPELRIHGVAYRSVTIH